MNSVPFYEIFFYQVMDLMVTYSCLCSEESDLITNNSVNQMDKLLWRGIKSLMQIARKLRERTFATMTRRTKMGQDLYQRAKLGKISKYRRISGR